MLDTIHKDFTAAMKAGDKKAAAALKLLYSALKNAAIDAGGTLTETAATAVIKKEMKKRVEARDMYAQNNRDEQAAQEEFERSLYSIYVPQDMSEQAIDDLIAEVASSLSAPVAFSVLMPAVMQKAKGKADGRMVSERVKAYIETNT